MPSAVRGRAGDGTAAWTYDRRAVETVVAACRWRAVTRDLDVVRVRLWLDGHPQPPAEVRASLARVTARAARAFAVATRDGDPGAVDELAGRIARSRPRDGTGFPRFVRTSLADRAEGIGYVLRLFGSGDSAPPTEGVARNAEKVLGVSRGRRRTSPTIGPWIEGPAATMAAAASSASLPALREALATATDSELAAARSDVATLALFLPAVVDGVAAFTGDESAAGMAFARHLLDPAVPVLLVPFAVSVRRDPALSPGLETVLTALAAAGPVVFEVRDFLALTGDDVLADAAARLDPAGATALHRFHATATKIEVAPGGPAAARRRNLVPPERGAAR